MSGLCGTDKSLVWRDCTAWPFDADTDAITKKQEPVASEGTQQTANTKLKLVMI